MSAQHSAVASTGASALRQRVLVPVLDAATRAAAAGCTARLFGTTEERPHDVLVAVTTDDPDPTVSLWRRDRHTPVGTPQGEEILLRERQASGPDRWDYAAAVPCRQSTLTLALSLGGRQRCLDVLPVPVAAFLTRGWEFDDGLAADVVVDGAALDAALTALLEPDADNVLGSGGGEPASDPTPRGARNGHSARVVTGRAMHLGATQEPSPLEQIVDVDGILFQPWVGAAYWESGEDPAWARRLLVLGESHWGKPEHDERPDTTRDLLRRYAAGGHGLGPAGRFFTKALRLAAGPPRIRRSQTTDVLRRVAFANAVQRIVGPGPKYRPSEELGDWAGAADATSAILTALRPTHVLVLGYGLWWSALRRHGVPITPYPEFTGDGRAPWSSGEGRRPGLPLAWCVRHPSSVGFSYAAAMERVAALFTVARGQ